MYKVKTKNFFNRIFQKKHVNLRQLLDNKYIFIFHENSP